MATKQGITSFRVNDLEMNWDEDSRRVLKPCVKCSKPTRGRMANGGGIKKAAHISCAMALTIDSAVKVYAPPATE